MNSSLEKYNELKSKAERAQQNADRAEGALGQVKKRLADEFDCPNLKAAKKKLAQLEEQEEDAKEKFDDAVEAFEKEWEGEL